jgi:hypothetical protein
MIKKMYSIYDVKAEAFFPPFYTETEGLALRMIMETLSDPNSNLSKYPADFTLFYLGEFDDNTAEITYDKKPMGTMIEYMPQVNKED